MSASVSDCVWVRVGACVCARLCVCADASLIRVSPASGTHRYVLYLRLQEQWDLFVFDGWELNYLCTCLCKL